MSKFDRSNRRKKAKGLKWELAVPAEVALGKDFDDLDLTYKECDLLASFVPYKYLTWEEAGYLGGFLAKGASAEDYRDSVVRRSVNRNLKHLYDEGLLARSWIEMYRQERYQFAYVYAITEAGYQAYTTVWHDQDTLTKEFRPPYLERADRTNILHEVGRTDFCLRLVHEAQHSDVNTRLLVADAASLFRGLDGNRLAIMPDALLVTPGKATVFVEYERSFRADRLLEKLDKYRQVLRNRRVWQASFRQAPRLVLALDKEHVSKHGRLSDVALIRETIMSDRMDAIVLTQFETVDGHLVGEHYDPLQDRFVSGPLLELAHIVPHRHPAV